MADDVVIIGAPRSGTNMLRDVLTSLPGFGTWACDEINLTWRHGNRDFPSDELTADHAAPDVRRYLGAAFDRIRRQTGSPCVVEKTCANSLRVEFVHRVLPDARFVLITRDGLDATGSALGRWHAPFDLRYTARKVRYVPASDLAYYGQRFAANQWRRRRGHDAAERSHGWWGPKTHDWEQLAATRPLDELAMIQWQRCVEIARRGLARVAPVQVHHLHYEDFVADPQTSLRGLLDFLDRPEAFDERAVAGVRADSVGKGRAALSGEALGRLGAIGGDTLADLGYEVPGRDR